MLLLVIKIFMEDCFSSACIVAFNYMNFRLVLKNWMIFNFLLYNSDKTEVVVLGHLTNTLPNDVVTLDGFASASTTPVRNLCVISDQEMSSISHIKQSSRVVRLHLNNIDALPVSKRCRKTSLSISDVPAGLLQFFTIRSLQ